MIPTTAPDQPEKFDRRSHDIAADKQATLRAAFPEVFTEGGKIDFERLKLALGETVDAGKERYGMNWPGKADCFKTIQQPSMATLVPAKAESVAWDTTENLIIEGDNLEVLKLLQKSYLGRVKMIYIDPPYNTGNDFIYPDNYTESLDTYLRYTGQIDSEGRKYSTNTEADGRFHSKWLNMMYPRLYLARNLLCEDGIIFISIDDGEVDNLRKLCHEIFGEENFLGQLVWKKKYIGGKHSNHFVDLHDFILVFARQADSIRGILIDRPEDEVAKFEHEDEFFAERGKYYIRPLKSNLEERKTLVYPIELPDGNSITTQWMVSRSTFDELVKTGRIVFKQKQDGSYQVYRKFYEKDGGGQVKFPTIIDDVSNADGKLELKTLFQVGEGRDIPFSNPKPSELIRMFVRAATASDDLVLDFFAGSGSTAHAVLESNRQDQSNRKYILVQLPEPTERTEFTTIAEVMKERVRRVIKKLNDEDAGKLALESGAKPDRGFKVFKLQSSNFKTWNADVPKEPAALTQQLEMHVHHIVEGRTQEDLLFEILLKSGFPPTTPIETLTLAGQTVFSIAEGAMLICLEKKLTPEVIKEMAARKPQRVVCLDEGFASNDQLKTNAVQTMKTKGVTSFRTV